MRSLEIVMLPQVMMMIVMMTRPPSKRHLQALLLMRSLLSSTLHHVSWLRPLRYNPMMSVMMRNKIKMKVIVIVMMMMIDMLDDAKEHFDIKRRE